MRKLVAAYQLLVCVEPRPDTVTKSCEILSGVP
jgi:hypothetical protein